MAEARSPMKKALDLDLSTDLPRGESVDDSSRPMTPERNAPGRTVPHVTAGPAALSSLSRLLRIPLKGACAQARENVRFDFGKLAVVLDRSGLKVEESPTGPAAERLLAVMRKRLGGRGLAEVLGLIAADPRSFREEIDPGQEGDQLRVPCVGQPIGLQEAGWRNFFADQDFEIILGVPECVAAGTVTIQYCDMECYYARPRRSFRKWTFLDWPEIGLDELPRGKAETAPALLVTELEERDMILGTGERADRLVEEAKRLSAEGKFLIFTHLCTPIIMGEDFQGLARRCEKEIGGTSVSWSQKDRDENNNFGAFLKSLLGRPGFFKSPARPAAVNLFHFPMGLRDEELKPFLRSVGIETNISVFPDVDFPALEGLAKAACQVFCERSSYPSKARELLAASPRKVITVPAPYGLERTKQCLQAIAAALGKQRRFKDAWSRKMAAFLPDWEAMRKQAAAYRLAFVVSEATLPRLLELRYGHGAPLAAMVKEMGFGIDLLYYDRHGQAPRLPEPLRHARVSVVRSPWELEQALKAGDFAAVFSDIFLDWRISRAGKARFSSRDFEMGLEGARRTFRRLLQVCSLRFYQRYGAHLAPHAE
ncbi:MAG: hypothetical protein NTY77_15850 [Elusimicrobia bacterium]|nr:hypothetical protein [Elusimicrobiota bacterium]